MFTIVLIFHVIVSIGLILVVLMQSSKGEGLAGTAFGGSLSGAVFGGRGAASFLSRATTILAVLFMVNCAALAFMSSTGGAMRGPGTAPTESPITKQAQAERELMMRQQQQQQQQQQAVPPESLLNMQTPSGEATEGAPSQSTDSAGK